MRAPACSCIASAADLRSAAAIDHPFSVEEVLRAGHLHSLLVVHNTHSVAACCTCAEVQEPCETCLALQARL